MKKSIIFSIFAFAALSVFANEIPLVSNIYSRYIQSLNGRWNYIIDPLENGYYNHRLQPHENGFFENKQAAGPHDLVEYNFEISPSLDVPGDWNTQDERLLFYEGTIWYKKDFQLAKEAGKKVILYFGAVNYDAKVYVNGQKAGEHIGGYTPFNFDVTDLVHDGKNFVVVKVDNKRSRDGVPTVNMDWWNYGGITRDVMIAQVPDTYIEDYAIRLSKEKANTLTGWVKLNTATAGQSITLELPELKVKTQLTTGADGKATFELKAKPVLWHPENPKLYDLVLSKAGERIADRVGFRTIETKGKEIHLNGEKIFLRGICIHEEAPYRRGRAFSQEDARTLLGWAKEMGCNFVRLAHYPHNEYMVREAERMGLLVWSEIPVYWTINWSNPDTYRNAERQLHDMIYRDKNRCAVIVWSIANETPHSEARDRFLTDLSNYARRMDNTRLISMAMEVVHLPGYINKVEDNMNTAVDIISFNQYKGWYTDRGDMEECRIAKWEIPYDKPIVVSEWGGGALQGKHGDKSERWTEEFQAELYVRNLEMLNKIDGWAGTTPWVLMDFLSPRRQLPGIQDFFNRKGLISDQGQKKQAFYVLQDFYKQMK